MDLSKCFKVPLPLKKLALMSLRQLNSLKMASNKIYFRPNRLYQVITDLFFLANTAIPG